ncbi:hypothetical protein RCL1_005147 [Eukaryota sp. TZLM3-RCL]
MDPSSFFEQDSIEDTIEPASNASLLSNLIRSAEERRHFHRPAVKKELTRPVQHPHSELTPKVHHNTIEDIVTFYNSCRSSEEDIRKARELLDRSK